MPALLTCALGHQWDGDPLSPTPCPHCGGWPLRSDQRHLLADIPTQPHAQAPAGASRAEAPTVAVAPMLPADAPEPWAIPGYEILAELARGGMGIVYRARQLSLNRVVALKMMRRHQPDASELARFRIEAEAVARLDHPHVVRIHDFGEWQGMPYFSMELVEGGNLAAWFESGPLPVPQAAHLIEVLARAMHHAHQQHIVHRDLKPANVLLSRQFDGPVDGACFPRTPKIADFGLAKRLDNEGGLTQTDAVMGTASYMAPEQAEGRTHDIGAAADIYALGAILYEALTGRPPFRAATPELTRILVIANEPERPTHLRPDLPRDVEEICLKCLEKAPAQRYLSALALAEDLRRFQAGESLAITPLSDWEREVRWARPAGYEVLEVIGCTSLGMVYKARQRSLNRLVTLATISSRARTEPDQLARFRAEAEIAAHLAHPNIVQIYDLGEHNGQPYLSLEHLDGGTLSECCASHPLSAAQAAQLIELLAHATHHAHQRGIVHTDLRPFNVQLKAPHPSAAEQPADDDLTHWFGIPKITGFGLARLLEKPQQTARGWAWRRAFSNYMAPEQVAGANEAIGPATDIHALGAMLYELLAGQPPFLADSIDETLRRIQHEEPVPPSRLRDGVSRRLETICLKCLQKDPARRYTSAEELARDLHRYWAGKEPPTDEFELVPGYELLEELGQGGIGVVYKARQISLDRPVALKVFRHRLDRILAANRAVSRLSHPNLVQVYDCGERDGRLFVAEEFVEGGSLERTIAGRPQPPRPAAQLVETLARAAHYLHKHGIIHRNLKPSVILLTDLGMPKISSFDLARLLDHAPEDDELSGALLGTPAYMAPEQASSRPHEIGPATDVYALGEILYHLLTGARLFQAGSVADMLQQVLTEEPAPPSRLQPDVPAVLETICLRCLRKSPAERYPDAASLADALGDFLRSGA
jgi:serine/threonine protein kinase